MDWFRDYELRILKNFIDCMPKAYRKRNVNMILNEWRGRMDKCVMCSSAPAIRYPVKHDGCIIHIVLCDKCFENAKKNGIPCRPIKELEGEG